MIACVAAGVLGVLEDRYHWFACGAVSDLSRLRLEQSAMRNEMECLAGHPSQGAQTEMRAVDLRSVLKSTACQVRRVDRRGGTSASRWGHSHSRDADERARSRRPGACWHQCGTPRGRFGGTSDHAPDRRLHAVLKSSAPGRHQDEYPPCRYDVSAKDEANAGVGGTAEVSRPFGGVRLWVGRARAAVAGGGGILDACGQRRSDAGVVPTRSRRTECRGTRQVEVQVPLVFLHGQARRCAPARDGWPTRGVDAGKELPSAATAEPFGGSRPQARCAYGPVSAARSAPADLDEAGGCSQGMRSVGDGLDRGTGLRSGRFRCSSA